MKQYRVTKKIGKRFVPGNIVDEITYGRFSKDLQQKAFEEIKEKQSVKSEKVHAPKVEKTEEVVKTEIIQAEPKNVSRWKKETE